MITIGAITYNTPYNDLFPPLSEVEYQILKADISERGILVSIVIDTERNIIDGQNRLRLAAELGITDIPFDIRVGLSDEEKRQLALDLNLHRRHLDKKQRKLYEIEMRQNGKTNEDIGKTLGIAESTVRNDLETVYESQNCDSYTVLDIIQNGKVKNKRGAIRPKKYKSSIFTRSQREANQALNTLQSVANLPEGILTLADVKREKKRERHRQRVEATENIELPTGKYHVIVVDPGWEYQRQDDPTHRAANPYQQMTIEEIRDFPIPDLAFDDCILWLWTTNAFMEEAHQIARVWGFEKKTILTWVKDKMGMGDWLRGQTEHCLMCIKGKPVVDLSNQSTIIYGPLREHSRKPDSFYELVESLCPGQKVELFARQIREGWAAHGNQLHTF